MKAAAGRKTLHTVLIADDSRITRSALRSLFEQLPDFAVVGEAASSDETIRLTQQLRPRLVTVDLDMPGGGGLNAIESIMASAPTRVLVVTGVPAYCGLDAAFESLSRGALELVVKPAAWDGDDGERFLAVARRVCTVPVITHVQGNRTARHHVHRKAAATADTQRATAAVAVSAQRRYRLVAVGASTGGPRVLKQLAESLPADFSLPVVAVQHLADIFAGAFVQWLGASTKVPVREAKIGEKLKRGTFYVALRGRHLTVTPESLLQPCDDPPRCEFAPSIDIFFESVAKSFGRRGIGVLLTGMGRDGALGLKSMSDAGAMTLAQDEASSAVFGMPKAAADLGAVHQLVAGDRLCDELLRVTAGRATTVAHRGGRY